MTHRDYAVKIADETIELVEGVYGEQLQPGAMGQFFIMSTDPKKLHLILPERIFHRHFEWIPRDEKWTEFAEVRELPQTMEEEETTLSQGQQARENAVQQHEHRQRHLSVSEVRQFRHFVRLLDHLGLSAMSPNEIRDKLGLERQEFGPWFTLRQKGSGRTVEVSADEFLDWAVAVGAGQGLNAIQVYNKVGQQLADARRDLVRANRRSRDRDLSHQEIERSSVVIRNSRNIDASGMRRKDRFMLADKWYEVASAVPNGVGGTAVRFFPVHDDYDELSTLVFPRDARIVVYRTNR